MNVEADRTEPAPVQRRRVKLAFVAGGISIAGGAIFLALFRGVTAFTLVELPGILYVVGNALLVHLLGAIGAAAKAAARSFRPRKPASDPWTYPALPAESEAAESMVLYANVAVQLSGMVALALIAAAALVVLPFDRSLAGTLFHALLFVLLASGFSSVILTAAGRIELLIRWLLARRRPT